MIAPRFGYTLYGSRRHLLAREGDVAYCGVEVWRGVEWVEPDERPYSDECSRCRERERELDELLVARPRSSA